MILWDLEAEAPIGALQWRNAAPGSVPAHLEANADRLRAKYLVFIRDFGERVSGALTDDGFNFWWTTRLAEKSPFKSPAIYSCLRLLALEEILLDRRPESLELASGDADLSEAVEALCENLGISFEHLPAGSPRPRLCLPHELGGFLSFVRWIVTRAPLADTSHAPWAGGDDAVFICSFFLHGASYWGPLPEALRDARRPVNWLQHWLSGYGYDAGASNPDAHAFLESYLSIGVVLRAFERWLRLWGACSRVGALAFRPKGSAADLGPLLRDDWALSLGGRVGALNCLWVELFDAALADIPKQKTGIYLWENQSWEPALLRAWRKHGHGELTGYAHATVPYWHLYYFDAPGSKRPVPDRLAINGPAAARTFAAAGAPAVPLVEVEALRYLPLAKTKRKAGASKVLVLGDAIPESTDRLLANLPEGFEYAFKPHPLYKLESPRCETVDGPLDRLLPDYRAAVTGNSTSAAVDALEAGLPVFVEYHGRELNLSPLRGESGARFFGNAAELTEGLRAAVPAEGGFFHLDSALPRWRKLLQLGKP